MKVVALHGDFASGSTLRRDMDDPSWVDEYWDWTNLKDIVRQVRAIDRVVLVGYSRGASRIAWLAGYTKNIAAAVIYESPNPGIGIVDGTFPAMLIWNNNGRAGTGSAIASDLSWAASDRTIDRMKGNGRHTRFAWGWPPIAHGWDRSLNESIRDWIVSKT